ncbi:heme peroxidase-related protein [Volvox carteri f. nagariensis]|uniref:Heme peroxidase-related protein n=1 Tax=Volvox carteri f. nagariensis TaxID=3068 RepID=D8UDB8_VOLCA|nr:heme peroxidase-related protein [Volvox carteri f. nagariensis]EFJ42238.1 heme peroxidase-related protein [Volvox carteri f. nagariensis]|eukprot:XP_002956636.1 heme peroxidase-related protein [Volvox carteri f. nagariensis]
MPSSWPLPGGDVEPEADNAPAEVAQEAARAAPEPVVPPLVPVVPEVSKDRVPLYPAELAAAAAPARVCVTGATGYVAGPIVARLLAAGHTVHATCRDPSASEALSALRALPGADQRLRLFRGDLLTPGSFDEAVEGCDYVIHTASPFTLLVNRRRAVEQLVEPAVRGVENVIAAVNKTKSVRRVVMTSSIVATYSRATDHGGPDRPLDENCWNTTASPTFLPYSYSKTQAERRAWELCEKQNRWTLVVINPGLVLGPPLGANCRASESVALLRRICAGLMYPAVPNVGIAYVDIRDVAAAHSVAMTAPEASGRYLVVAGGVRMRGLTQIMEQLYPGGRVRTAFLAAPRWIAVRLAPLLGIGSDFVEASWGPPPRFSTVKAAEQLGLKSWVPLEASLYDMVEDLAAKRLVRHPLVSFPSEWSRRRRRQKLRRWLLCAAAVAVPLAVAVVLLVWMLHGRRRGAEGQRGLR